MIKRNEKKNVLAPSFLFFDRGKSNNTHIFLKEILSQFILLYEKDGKRKMKRERERKVL